MWKVYLAGFALAVGVVPSASAAYISAYSEVRVTEWPFGLTRFSDDSTTRPVAVSATDYLYWGYGGESGAAAGGDPSNATTWARAYARGRYGVSQSANAIVRASQDYVAPSRANPWADPVFTTIRAINFIPELALLAGDDEELTILGPVCRGIECGIRPPSQLLLQAGEGEATWSFFQDIHDFGKTTRLMTATIAVRVTAAGFELLENSCQYYVWTVNLNWECQPLQGYFVSDKQGRMGVWFDPQFLVGQYYNVQGPFTLSYGASLTVSGRFLNGDGLRILFADPQELEYQYPSGFQGPTSVASAAAVPEPATWATMSMAVAVFVTLARRRQC